MAGRRTNLALLGALVVALVTGWMAFGAGTGWGRPVVVAHGVTGLAIVALAPWKSVIARRGLRRPRPGRPSSLVLFALIVASLAAGIAHSAGVTGRAAGLTMMQLHVGAALAAMPFAAAHLVRRPVRVRLTDLSRRNLLRGLGVVGGGALVYAGLESVSKLLSLPGARRRFTGSHEIGSHEPAKMPVTQWLDDRVPEISADRWSLPVRSAGTERSWSLDELEEKRVRITATLDCTGGWYAEQDWHGVPLRTLLPDGTGRSIVVRSSTGYARRFPIADLDRLFLATGVEDAPLSAGHGFPARIVAPGRRGFWWVKWVEEIEVDDRPWWAQLPFPAT
jgi:hypothetical protein